MLAARIIILVVYKLLF